MIVTELRSLRWADLFLFALLDPRALYRQIERNEPKSFMLSFLVPAAVAVFDIITLSIMGRQTPFFYYKITYGWILLFLYQSLTVILAAALMDMAAQFFGFKGNVRQLHHPGELFTVSQDIHPSPRVYIQGVQFCAPVFLCLLFPGLAGLVSADRNTGNF